MNKQVTSLYKAYEKYFPVGAAVNPLSVGKHNNLLLHHFNSLTADNSMKFSHLQPVEDTYLFDASDMIVAFAKKHDMKVRGHTFIWYKQTPDWVFINKNKKPVTRKILLERIQKHIHTVMTHFKDDLYCWDVVNEAIADDQGYLRPCKWLDIIGEDYVAKSFEIAHAENPGSLLFYNDFDIIFPEKRNKVIRLIKDLKKRDIPVHGLGIQAHWNIYEPGIEEIKTALGMYANLGLQLQITELDVSYYKAGDTNKLETPPPELIERQAEYYDSIFSLFRQYKDVITGVTFWGVADDMTWLKFYPVPLRNNWPFLFDADHKPKDAFYKVIDFYLQNQ